MIQFTTQPFTMLMPPTIDMERVRDLCFTVKQKNDATQTLVVINKRGSDIVVEGSTVYACLSQEDTGLLSTGVCKVQLNWMYEGYGRMASFYKKIRVDENLLQEVIE